MRALEDWADKKYAPGSAIAHVFPFGDQAPLCGTDEVGLSWEGWHGTGSFDEIERAQKLPLCIRCKGRITTPPPAATFNEFTAPTPLYAHTEYQD